MSIIRHTQKFDGIDSYLEIGKKEGREHTRDEMDERIPIMGDLDEVSSTIELSKSEKDWKTNYLHTTVGLAADEQHLIEENPELFKELGMDIARYMFGPGVNLDNVVMYAEYHKPKLHSTKGKHGKIDERLGHVHYVFSKHDLQNDKQFRLNPFNDEFDEAFQTYICHKFGLVDPLDRQRAEPKENILQRYKGDIAKAESIQGRTKSERCYYSELLEGVTSYQEIAERLTADQHSLENIKSFEINTKGKNPRLVVKMHDDHEINLHGRGFDDVMKAVMGNESYAAHVASGKHVEGLDPVGKRRKKLSFEEAQAKVEERMLWMYERNLKDLPNCERIFKDDEQLRERGEQNIKLAKPSKGHMTPEQAEKTGRQWKNDFDAKSAEQCNYWKAYGTEIREELIQGFKIASNKDGSKKLLNHEKGIYINERGNELTVESSMGLSARSDAVAILLHRAMDKGADITKLQLVGSAEFKAEVRSQVNGIVVKNEYQAPSNPTETVTLKEVGEKKPTTTCKATAAESGRNIINAINKSDIVSSDKETINVAGSQINENDDAWTIFLKVSAAMEAFYKKLDAQNEELRRELEIRGRKIRAEQEAFIESFISNLVKMFNQHVKNYPPVQAVSVGSTPKQTASQGKSKTSKRRSKRSHAVSFKSSVNGYTRIKGEIAEIRAQKEVRADLVALNKLDPREVLKFAQTNNNLLLKNYEVTADNKIRDLRNPNAAPKSNIDFLSKTCCMTFKDAVYVLSEISKDLGAQKAQETTQVLNSDTSISGFLANVAATLPEKERKIEANAHKRDQENRAHKAQEVRDRRSPENCQTLFESLTKLQRAVIANQMSYQNVSLHEYMTSDLIREGVSQGNAFEYFLNSVQNKPNSQISFDQNGDLVIKRYKLDGGTIALDL